MSAGACTRTKDPSAVRHFCSISPTSLHAHSLIHMHYLRSLTPSLPHSLARPLCGAGLYAAGEVVGGIHGDNRLGGSRCALPQPSPPPRLLRAALSATLVLFSFLHASAITVLYSHCCSCLPFFPASLSPPPLLCCFMLWPCPLFCPACSTASCMAASRATLLLS